MNIFSEDNSEEILRQFRDAIERSLEAVGLQAESHAKLELENDPRRIDTGRLRNSIAHKVVTDSEDAVYIGTNVEYAIYVHEGTQKMRPNRFLKNAVMNNVDQYQKIVDHYMRNA